MNVCFQLCIIEAFSEKLFNLQIEKNNAHLHNVTIEVSAILSQLSDILEKVSEKPFGEVTGKFYSFNFRVW